MRTLNELISKYDSIWLIVDEDMVESFVEDCDRYGFRFNGGDAMTREKCGPQMGIALHVFNKTIWYVSGMSWYFSFTHPKALVETDPGAETCIKVNYKAFVSGEANYVYKTRSRSELFPPDISEEGSIQ